MCAFASENLLVGRVQGFRLDGKGSPGTLGPIPSAWPGYGS